MNELALIAILDWPDEDAETYCRQVQQFVEYVHANTYDLDTTSKVLALVQTRDRADYAFSVALYGLIGWPEGLTPDD